MTPLDERLSRAIEERILSGEYVAGEHLRQDDLAASFGVSHIPIREAFRRLAAGGFVDLHPRRGATVKRVTAAEILQLLDVRILLESAALRGACVRWTPLNTEETTAAIEAAERDPDPLHWPELNWRFHSALYRPSGQSVLTGLVAQLHDDSRSKRLHRLITLDIGESCKEHRRLLSLVKKGDADGAVSFLARHIGVSSPGLKKMLRSMEATS